ncbi:hypothetical protein BJA5080_07873 [Bradyrhizobium diazoefficiens SEMIA 5080]|uniref:Uncharacterized protein n=1 Tax=Bradyrhizobium diazoefficiens SEMIA 5080 TaxID=754504 RepID=A0A837CPK0_9BRAD|nr:hypothetical protein BJA5080_07873 [Bradyrhizobium diazoefficiens SEMIA 5080]
MRDVSFGVHARAPRGACCAELGPKSHGESACPLGNIVRENVRAFQDERRGFLPGAAARCRHRRSGSEPLKST